VQLLVRCVIANQYEHKKRHIYEKNIKLIIQKTRDITHLRGFKRVVEGGDSMAPPTRHPCKERGGRRERKGR
jgi:hypothetical protein